MKTRLTLLTFVLLFSFIDLQSQDIEFRCNGQLFSVRYRAQGGVYQRCEDYKRYTEVSNIPDQERAVIATIRDSLKKRGGQEFYNRITLEVVIISEDHNKCEQRKYALHYLFKIDTIFSYSFVLTFDQNGSQLSKFKFPLHSTEYDHLKIIDHCTALEIALSDTAFRRAFDNPGMRSSRENKKTGEWERFGGLSDLQLAYDAQGDKWTWLLYSEAAFAKRIGKKRKGAMKGRWVGKVITIDALTSKVLLLEDFGYSAISHF